MGACTSLEQSHDAKRYHAQDMLNYRSLMRAISPALDEPPEPVPEINVIIRDSPPQPLTPALKDPTRTKPLFAPAPASLHPTTVTPAMGYNRSPPMVHANTCSPSTTPGCGPGEMSPIMPGAAAGGVSAFEGAEPSDQWTASLTEAPHLSLPPSQEPVVNPIADPSGRPVEVDGSASSTTSPPPHGDPPAATDVDPSLREEDRLDGRSFTPQPINSASFLSPPTGISFAMSSPPATGAATFLNGGQRHVRFSPALDPSADSKHTPLARCKKNGLPSRHVMSPGATPLVPKTSFSHFHENRGEEHDDSMESSGSNTGTPYVAGLTFSFGAGF